MTEEKFGKEVSKRKGVTVYDVGQFLKDIPILGDAIRKSEEAKKRMEGTSKQEKKDEFPFGGEYK
jgi:hypothetical protein